MTGHRLRMHRSMIIVLVGIVILTVFYIVLNERSNNRIRAIQERDARENALYEEERRK